MIPLIELDAMNKCFYDSFESIGCNAKLILGWRCLTVSAEGICFVCGVFAMGAALFIFWQVVETVLANGGFVFCVADIAQV